MGHRIFIIIYSIIIYVTPVSVLLISYRGFKSLWLTMFTLIYLDDIILQLKRDVPSSYSGLAEQIGHLKFRKVTRINNGHNQWQSLRICLRPRTIKWQDWKCTSLVAFIIRRHNALCKYKLSKTSISKLIPSVSFHKFYRWWITMKTQKNMSLLKLMFCTNLNSNFNFCHALVFSAHFVEQLI